MNTILPKTRLPSLSSSTHKFKNARIRFPCPGKKSNSYSAKTKETFIFLQNGFSRVSFGCTTAFHVPEIALIQKRNFPHEPGSGAGKGGGAGGAVREAGGSLGKRGAAKEEQFFHNKTREEIERLKREKKDQPKEDDPEKKQE